MPQHKRLKQNEVIAISEYLKDKMEIRRGRYAYKPGYSDKVVAANMARMLDTQLVLPHKSVASIRRLLYGKANARGMDFTPLKARLREVIDPETRQYYRRDVNDDVLGAEFNVSHSHVATIRGELFGKTYPRPRSHTPAPAPAPEKPIAMQPEIETIETLLAELVRQMGDFVSQEKL